MECNRPRITYNNICLIRGRNYSTSFHHRIWRKLDGINLIVDNIVCHSDALVNIYLHASICFRHVPLLEEFKEHPAFRGAKSGTQERVIVLGENSSQTDQSAKYFS